MMGKNIGFQQFFQAANYDHITFTHCLIHREALVAKRLAPELDDALQDAVKIINFDKSHALNSRFFQISVKIRIPAIQIYYYMQK